MKNAGAEHELERRRGQPHLFRIVDLERDIIDPAARRLVLRLPDGNVGDVDAGYLLVEGRWANAVLAVCAAIFERSLSRRCFSQQLPVGIRCRLGREVERILPAFFHSAEALVVEVAFTFGTFLIRHGLVLGNLNHLHWTWASPPIWRSDRADAQVFSALELSGGLEVPKCLLEDVLDRFGDIGHRLGSERLKILSLLEPHFDALA